MNEIEPQALVPEAHSRTVCELEPRGVTKRRILRYLLRQTAL
jgi:hypothetical protein